MREKAKKVKRNKKRPKNALGKKAQIKLDGGGGYCTRTPEIGGGTFPSTIHYVSNQFRNVQELSCICEIIRSQRISWYSRKTILEIPRERDSLSFVCFSPAAPISHPSLFSPEYIFSSPFVRLPMYEMTVRFTGMSFCPDAAIACLCLLRG